MVTKLTLEYDGSEFAGWARQPELRTVQGELERALRTLLGERGVDGEPLALTVAGRTDRGVHAWGQVASYAHEALDPARLNALLPPDVAVLASEPAPAGFDARRDARSRTYCYRVLARRARGVFTRGHALWWPQPVDCQALEECARALVGRHDFTAFTPTETDHVRFERDVLRAEWRTASAGVPAGAEGLGNVYSVGAPDTRVGARVGAEGLGSMPSVGAPDARVGARVGAEGLGSMPSVGAPDARGGARVGAEGLGSMCSVGAPDARGRAWGELLLEFWIEADTFMRHMNRVLVGTMLEVAAGRRTVEEFVRLLEGRPRPEAGPTAPAHGLALASVTYG